MSAEIYYTNRFGHKIVIGEIKKVKVLSTIQKRENLNDIYRFDEKGPGGGYHDYVIANAGTSEQILHIKYQKGPRKDPNARHGVLDEDLLEIVRDRLTAFQSGPYATREGENALSHVEEALMWLSKRKEDRYERGVLGTMEQ